ncbi:Hybrid signal transduction histidine kinase J [Ceratocystis lukuohia]|uniref:Hybrid signal transduction histidine kinase J n=1 Tax=Ceratocystis lukuohia TaxID=2019550 RepID=A0ABR4MRY3_9PEZI
MGLDRALDGSSFSAASRASTQNDQAHSPPPQLYERLRLFSGYTWDESKPPIHTPNDIWLVHGTRFISPFSGSSSGYSASPGGLPARGMPCRVPTFPVSTPDNTASPPAFQLDTRCEQPSTISPPPISASTNEAIREEPIVARVTYNVFREERNFQVAKSVTVSSNQKNLDYIVKPLDFLRLSPIAADRGAIIVTIYEDPGDNDIMHTMDLGPAFYTTEKRDGQLVPYRNDKFDLGEPVSLTYFLDFAIGAARCLEMLHHQHEVVHGEIRGDSFHYNLQENKVKIFVFGSGIKFFEHGLYGSTWHYYLAHGLGSRNRLLYISPEQTGRMAVEPDTRTDIYSLGIVFWTMLTRQHPFEGESVMEIIQSILRHRIADVSQIRLDVPQAISDIIQKCTAKAVSDRYHSATGLRRDLQFVQQSLVNGNLEALQGWKTGTRDFSSLFTLPSAMIGRDAERDILNGVVERVACTTAVNPNIAALSRSSTALTAPTSAGPAEPTSSTPYVHDSFVDASGDVSSENGSCSLDGFNKTGPNSIELKRSSTTASGSGLETLSNLAESSPRLRAWERNQTIHSDTLSISESLGTGTGDGIRIPSVEASADIISRPRSTIKTRGRGQCEVVTIEGAAGLGKSLLVQSVLTDMRKRGYCATGKFDNARRHAFGPLLKLLSALFKQVWGERNTETPFHQALRTCVEPIWPQLHEILSLPAWLLKPEDPQNTSSSPSISSSRQASPPALGLTVPSIASMHARRGSSPITPATASPASTAVISSTKVKADPLDITKGLTGNKGLRMINIVLEIIRLFARHKFLCICLDDLHFADDESLDLISQIINAKIRMVVIMTYRPDEISAERVHGLIHPIDCEDCTRPGPTITKIRLNPLKDGDIVTYVAATLQRPREEVAPLARMVQAKCAGNPFYMREMLTACNRKRCITYEHRTSRWVYDRDKVHENFDTDQDYDVLDSGFITQRLGELPPATRAILIWASLLGNTFSFQLICHLLSSDFVYHKCEDAEEAADETPADIKATETNQTEQTQQTQQDAHIHHRPYTQAEAIMGLNAAIQASVLVPSEVDDRFRFAHDRYVQAATAMRPCSLEMMHLVIAQTLLKRYSEDERLRTTIAGHLCEAVEAIKKCVPNRSVYRKLLCESAQAAIDSGARPTAAKFYTTAVALLQDDAWSDTGEDSSYDETWALYLKAADCALYLGHHAGVFTYINEVLKHGRTPFDKAPAHVISSRVLSQIGNSDQALASLKNCVNALGVSLDAEPSFEKCSRDLEALEERLKSLNFADIVNSPQAETVTLPRVGAVLVEALVAAWWSDSLTLYNLALVTVEMYFTCGFFPQAGAAFVFLGMIAITNEEKIELGVRLGDIGTALLSRADPEDPLVNRGWTMYYKFISHLKEPLSLANSQIERIILSEVGDGNFVAKLLASGLSAMTKLSTGESCGKLEAWCNYCCEDMPGWEQDTRGGTLLLAVRQTVRAFQGKTMTSNPLEILSDQDHTMSTYKQWLNKTVPNGGRSLIIYETFELYALVAYGHFQQAVEVGKRCVENIDMLWSVRGNRQSLLLYSWALTATTLEKAHDKSNLDAHTSEELRDSVNFAIAEIEKATRRIELLTTVSDLNYKHWISYMGGFVKELQGCFGDAVRLYEVGISHSIDYNFPIEEAMGQVFMCGLLARREAPWLASRCLQESTSLFRNAGSFGVAEYLEASFQGRVPQRARKSRTVDMGVQTEGYMTHSRVNASYNDSDARESRYHSDPYTRGANQRTHSIMNNPSIHRTTENDNDSPESRIVSLEKKWRAQNKGPESRSFLSELDIIDLQAILHFSQIISSALKVEVLLNTMCDVILQTCGSATLVGIITKDPTDESWVLSASGSPEKGASAHMPGLSLDLTNYVAENVIYYCTRFRESVFVQDIATEERFGNLNQDWIDLNPNGKAIIAIPIEDVKSHMQGVLYVEGDPSSFTDRNFTVLALLVNQMSISYSNAQYMKALEKASAQTISAAGVQKRALGEARAAEQKARDAESKAKRAEEEAVRNVKLAEEAARAKSSFLANVSHELRTPLNGVIGNADLLSRGDLDAEQQEIAESIRVSADLLLVVINDLLDFSRIEAEKMQLHIQEFTPYVLLSEIIRAARFTYKDRYRNNQVEIIEDIQLPRSLNVMGDPIRLHQVLGNLVSNSAKFTEKGSITIGAKIVSETPTSCVLDFWVIDTGMGIEKDVLPQLFQPFSQADNSTSRAHGGSGLGLSICKSLVQTVMGGKISLTSEHMKGTEVRFRIEFEKFIGPSAVAPPESATPAGLASPPTTSLCPIVSTSAPHIQPVIESSNVEMLPSPDDNCFPKPNLAMPNTTSTRISTTDIRVCVAEDNAINRRIAVQFLRRLGYVHIDTYENGQLAIDGLQRMASNQTPYHLVLMDVQMPVLDGYSATKKIRLDPVPEIRDVLIIAMTASAIHGDREKCLEAGMNDYLAKPVKSEVLKNKIDAYFRVSDSRVPKWLPTRAVKS